jgi:hypothetical protein
MPPPAMVSRARKRLRDERGSFLVEVVVSAVVLATVATAILAGVDGSITTASRNRARSIESALAEQDQERMRSFRASQLNNYSQTRTVTVAGIGYSVASKTEWWRDGSGTVSCTNDSSQASYMRITSTVSPLAGRPGPTVTQSSLLTPSNGTFDSTQGLLAVAIVDRNGNPRPGLNVNLTGNGVALSSVGNSAGCSVFGYLAQGNYTVTASAPGLVDRSGSTSPSQTAGVVGGTATVFTMELDQPTQINTSFDTKVGTANPVPAMAQSITVTNPNLPAPGTKSFSIAPAPFPTTPNTISATNLYPFTGGYAVYAGSCSANDPRTYSSTYFNTNPGLLSVTPGATQSVTVRVPAINVVVKNSSNVTLTNANVLVTPIDSGCTETYPVQKTNSSGAMPNPGYPFGNYLVCADDGARRKRTILVTNTVGTGTATNTITLPSSQSTTGCP